MSYRGSFSTEYIYCKECFKIVKDTLLPYYPTDMIYKEHIVSGKISDLDEITMEIDFEDKLLEISEQIKDNCIIRIILFGETFTTYYKVSKNKVDIIYKEENNNE